MKEPENKLINCKYLSEESEYKSNPTYYQFLLEQWKTATQLASNISSQRQQTNNFYMTAMTMLTSGLLFICNLENITPLIRWIVGFGSVIGLICCICWFIMIRSFSKINAAKYHIINEIEQYLPANVLNYEHELKTASKKSKDKKYDYVSFAKVERIMPLVFAVLFVLVAIINFIIGISSK